MIPLSARYLTVPELHMASVVMIVFSIFTVLLSAYAAMPKIPLKIYKQKQVDIENLSFNILFLGSFFNMEYNDFKKTMEEVLNDHSKAYEVQVREIYSIGRYLAKKKYLFVSMAYLSFILGIVLSSLIYSLNLL